MKIELEKVDIEAIAAAVAVHLQPLLKVSHGNAPNPIMDVQELAKYLRVTSSWVYKQIQFKSVPHFHVGRYPRFHRKEIDSWIERESVSDTSPSYPKRKLAK